MTTGDEVAATLRRKRNMKCCAYIVIRVMLETIIIVMFALTVMRVKTPKVRLGSVMVEIHNTTTSSFNMRLIAKLTVKNTNFGHFKFENTTATITYEGAKVGQALIVKGRAKARETRRMDITVDVSSDRLSGASGTFTLGSQAKLSGKVHLFKIIKKKKSAEMSCTMVVDVANSQILNLSSK
ncbi:hypothetical protein HHK36_000144 [Tetracentron sinense]|uniref:Late embryogenesis abundant protein LEA-2 subgroup domain-containing protein n=1 Tax=Tetracentron sinense TaxID=13715 RepID=A0A834ZUZ4_TETSI|nr:hypothetical protein HHK36_000144 [Tetracentron sinense]